MQKTQFIHTFRNNWSKEVSWEVVIETSRSNILHWVLASRGSVVTLSTKMSLSAVNLITQCWSHWTLNKEDPNLFYNDIVTLGMKPTKLISTLSVFNVIIQCWAYWTQTQTGSQFIHTYALWLSKYENYQTDKQFLCLETYHPMLGTLNPKTKNAHGVL